jgi:hypothetical protein
LVIDAPAAELSTAAGEVMNEGDNKPAGKVIPFANSIQGAIAEELRRMYSELVRETLPDDISALIKQFEELSKKGSEEKS